MKTISLIGRRHDFDREGFRDYYETRHAPLAIRHFPFRSYVRNHVVTRSAGLPEFDVLPEFEFDDIAPVLQILASPTGQIIRDDEARFMGTLRNAAEAETHCAREGPRSRRRTILFLKRSEAAVDRQSEIDAAREWAEDIAARAGIAATIDVTSGFAGAVFPADLLVSFWTADDLPSGAPPGLERLGQATFDVVETSREALAQGRIT